MSMRLTEMESESSVMGEDARQWLPNLRLRKPVLTDHE